MKALSCGFKKFRIDVTNLFGSLSQACISFCHVCVEKFGQVNKGYIYTVDISPKNVSRNTSKVDFFIESNCKSLVYFVNVVFILVT